VIDQYRLYNISVILLLLLLKVGIVTAAVPCADYEEGGHELTRTTVDSLIQECFENRMGVENKLGEYARQIICFGEKASDEVILGKGNYILGMKYYLADRLDSALHHLFIAHNISNTQGTEEVIAFASNFLGLTYRTLGHYDLALSFQQEHYNYGESVGNIQIQGSALTNMASIFFYSKNFEKSRDYQLQALEIFTNADTSRIEAKENLMWLYRSLGMNYENLNDQTNAQIYYQKALTIGTRLNFTRGKLWTLYRITDFYAEKELAVAEKYLKQAMSLFDGFENKHIGTSLMYLDAKILNLKGDAKGAIAKLEKAQNLAEQFEYQDLETNIFELLLKISKENNFRVREMKFLRLYQSRLNERANSINSESLSIWIENQKKIVKQQRENLSLKKIEYDQQESITNQRIIILGVVLALFALGLYVFYSRKINRKSIEHNRVLQDKNNDIADQLELIATQKSKLEEANLIIKEERSKLKNELAQKMIHIANEQEMLSNLSKLLEDIDISKDGKVKINKYLHRHNRETIWEEFDQEVSSSNEAFFSKLAAVSPKLTSNDFRLAALIKMNLDNKEIARLLFRSVESIHMAKSRLRKKLSLNKDSMNLVAYFNYIMDDDVKSQ